MAADTESKCRPVTKTSVTSDARSCSASVAKSDTLLSDPSSGINVPSKSVANTFKFDGGIVQFVQNLNRAYQTLHAPPIHLTGERDGVEVEVSLQYNESFNENVFSYVNNIRTTEV